MGFILNSLHFIALIFLVRLTLPKRYLLLNPFAAAMDYQLTRLLAFVQTGVAVPIKGACALLLVLTLAGRAAILATHTDPLLVSPLAIFAFNAEGFLGWFALELLHFGSFYFSVLSAFCLLRLWHGLRVLPGYTGDLLHLAVHPFSRLKLSLQWPVLIGFGIVLFTLASQFANVCVYPMNTVFDDLAKQLPADLQQIESLLKMTDLQQLPAFAWYALMIFMSIMVVAIEILDVFFIFLLISLFTMGNRSTPLGNFIADAIRLICGPIRNVRLGPINIAPLLAFFAISSLYFVITAVFITLIMGLVYVV